MNELKKLIELENEINELKRKNSGEFVSLFGTDQQARQELFNTTEKLTNELEKLVKSIEGKTDKESLLIVHCLTGGIIINKELHWDNQTIKNYLTPEQKNILNGMKIEQHKKQDIENRKKEDDSKMNNFVDFVKEYNEKWGTNIKITGINKVFS